MKNPPAHPIADSNRPKGNAGAVLPRVVNANAIPGRRGERPRHLFGDGADVSKMRTTDVAAVDRGSQAIFAGNTQMAASPALLRLWLLFATEQGPRVAMSRYFFRSTRTQGEVSFYEFM